VDLAIVREVLTITGGNFVVTDIKSWDSPITGVSNYLMLLEIPFSLLDTRFASYFIVHNIIFPFTFSFIVKLCIQIHKS